MATILNSVAAAASIWCYMLAQESVESARVTSSDEFQMYKGGYDLNSVAVAASTWFCMQYISTGKCGIN